MLEGDTPLLLEDQISTNQDSEGEVHSQQADRGFEITPGQIHIPETQGSCFSCKKLLAFTGPGFLMSIAYLDPGNIESDLQAGAVAKYKLMWVLFWSTMMGLMLQLLAARLGSVTGLHLAQVCHEEYPKAPRIVLWLMMEIAIIGSDIQEVIGSAIAINLLSEDKVPIWAGVLITGVDTFTFLFLESAGLRKLEAFFGVLITTMCFSFLYMFITVKPDLVEILKGLAIPWCTGCNKEAIQQLVGIIGAIIMPHNIYLHSALVLSRGIDRSDRSQVKEANKYYSIESVIALFLSFLINVFVVAVFAAAFIDVHFATLRQAGIWIGKHYFLTMKIIWGVGVLASGQSSTMTGTYAGQFVMEGFLKIRWSKWKRVLLTRSIAIVPTILVAILATKYLDTLNSWLNVLQSVQLPFALLPILHFTSSQRIMGEFKNGRVLQFMVWFVAVLDLGINAYLISLYVEKNKPWYVYFAGSVVGFLYLGFVMYLVLGIRKVLLIQRLILQKLGCNTEYYDHKISCLENMTYTTLQQGPDQ